MVLLWKRLEYATPDDAHEKRRVEWRPRGRRSLQIEEFDGTIGPYALVRKIGRGSMGTVYEAVDEAGRRVAIKVLTGELAVHEELVERFRREAVSAAHLSHPNITKVVDFGEEGDRLYMAMELLVGSDLKVLIEQGRTGSLQERLWIMTQVAAGMAHVHAANLVHRDIKPGNIHVTPEGVAKIMDFGLVRLGDSNMTATGMVMGSPAYMAPEQLKGARVDARSDIFAMGAVFYELLSGRRAFGGKGLTDLMMAVISREPVPLTECAPGTPAPVAFVVGRCLRKKPAERYGTAGELHAALEVLAFGQ
ncbi:MAG: serine/threonine-protein kinase [Solirubrobacterales bacterium]